MPGIPVLWPTLGRLAVSCLCNSSWALMPLCLGTCWALHPEGKSTLLCPSSPSACFRAQLDTTRPAMLQKEAPSSVFSVLCMSQLQVGPFLEENSLGIRDVANSSLHLCYQPRTGLECLMNT